MPEKRKSGRDKRTGGQKRTWRALRDYITGQASDSESSSSEQLQIESTVKDTAKEVMKKLFKKASKIKHERDEAAYWAKKQKAGDTAKDDAQSGWQPKWQWQQKKQWQSQSWQQGKAGPGWSEEGQWSGASGSWQQAAPDQPGGWQEAEQWTYTGDDSKAQKAPWRATPLPLPPPPRPPAAASSAGQQFQQPSPFPPPPPGLPPGAEAPQQDVGQLQQGNVQTPALEPCDMQQGRVQMGAPPPGQMQQGRVPMEAPPPGDMQQAPIRPPPPKALPAKGNHPVVLPPKTDMPPPATVPAKKDVQAKAPMPAQTSAQGPQTSGPSTSSATKYSAEKTFKESTTAGTPINTIFRRQLSASEDAKHFRSVAGMKANLQHLPMLEVPPGVPPPPVEFQNRNEMAVWALKNGPGVHVWSDEIRAEVNSLIPFFCPFCSQMFKNGDVFHFCVPCGHGPHHTACEKWWLKMKDFCFECYMPFEPVFRTSLKQLKNVSHIFGQVSGSGSGPAQGPSTVGTHTVGPGQTTGPSTAPSDSLSGADPSQSHLAELPDPNSLPEHSAAASGPLAARNRAAPKPDAAGTGTPSNVVDADASMVPSAAASVGTASDAASASPPASVPTAPAQDGDGDVDMDHAADDGEDTAGSTSSHGTSPEQQKRLKIKGKQPQP
jgi:hypothetical protein